MIRILRTAAAVAILVGLTSISAFAQPLGTFTWQTQPYCNRVVVLVTQVGATYTVDGYDDQCGGATRATVSGIATPNPNGTIGFGWTVVSGAFPATHLTATISLAGLGGTWVDDDGNSGTLVFNGAVAGSPRPRPGAGRVIATALVTPSGPSFVTARNFSAVTRPTTGVYCLTATLPAGLTLADVIPQVTVEWARSSGFDLLAYGSDTNTVGCATGEIPVHTYRLTGSPVTGVAASNQVAFHILLIRR